MKKPIQKSDDGVHATYCCKKHGCAYGEKDCPVEKGRIVQLYPCETCSLETKEELQLNQSIECKISKILKENLSIEISEFQKYGSSGIRVKLMFKDQEISESDLTLKYDKD